MAASSAHSRVFNGLGVVCALHTTGCGFKTIVQQSKLKHGEKKMTTEVNLAKQAIHDKFESQIKTAEAKLNTLKAQAETAKANVELRAITELLTGKQALLQKLHELKKSDGGQWEQAKADLQTHIADFEKSVTGIESKAKAKAN
jgi:hypothetical protein